MVSTRVAVVIAATAFVVSSGLAHAQTERDQKSQPAAERTTGKINYITTNRADLWRASQLTGVNVYNERDEHVGDISEVLVNKQGQVEAVVIGVGGFLGLGQRDVAVPFNTLEWVVQDRTDRTAREETTPTRPEDTPDRTETDTDVTDEGMTDRDRTNEADRDQTTVTHDVARDYPARAILREASKEELENAPEFRYSD